MFKISLPLLLTGLLLLSACSAAPAQKIASEQQNLSLLFNFATSTLDPHTDSSYVPVRAGIAETLIRLNDETLSIEPWLAKRWSSENGQVWTIELEAGLTFQNGGSVDAAAVKASLERSMKTNVAVKNALRIEKIEADGLSLRITTNTPFPEFPTELVHPNTAIIDVTETNYTNQPIGTGPFAVDSFQPGSMVKLVRYGGYWDGAAKVKYATFSFNEDANARSLALQSGEADIVFRPELESIESLKQNPGLTIESTSTFRVHQLTMNMERETLTDINVRKAIDALVNRQQMVDHLLLGHAEVAYGPFPSSFSFAPNYEETPQGLKAAQAFLEEAGYRQVEGVMQKDGEPLAFTLLTYNSRADLPLIAQVFQSEARQLGIAVKIRQVDMPEAYMAENRDWDLATYSNLTAPRGDAGYYLNATYHPNGALNFSGVNNDALTGMINDLNATIDPKERSQKTNVIAGYIRDHVYNTFMLYPNTLVAYNAEKVRNWKTYRSEYYMLTNKLEVN